MNERYRDSDNESPICHSMEGQHKYFQYYFNYVNVFIMVLVTLYVVSRFKLLIMSWYKNIKPLCTNLKIFILKMFDMHAPFTDVDFSYNDVMLG